MEKDKSNKIHNNFFLNLLSNKDNAKDFLKIALPIELRNKIDYSIINFDKTTYVSKQLRDSYADLIIKTKYLSDVNRNVDTDIYILIEHKSSITNKDAIFVQLLKYIYLNHQHSFNNKEEFRIIIPLVFYHGKEDWKTPESFRDQFKVSEEIKKYLLDFKYILYDIKKLDDKKVIELTNNIYLLSGLISLKGVFEEGIKDIIKILNLFYDSSILKEKEKLECIIQYTALAKKLTKDDIEKIIREEKIDGGEIVLTFIDQIKNEGKVEGKIEGKLEDAKRMKEMNIDIDVITKVTGLTKKEIENIN